MAFDSCVQLRISRSRKPTIIRDAHFRCTIHRAVCSPFGDWWIRAFGGRPKGEFIFTPLGRQQVTRLVARTKIAIDIECPVQTGFTMRTIEMMGSKRKIITTNSNVVKADFYHPNDIAVIDRLNPIASEAFLGQPFESLSDELLHRYSLAGWVDEVLPKSDWT